MRGNDFFYTGAPFSSNILVESTDVKIEGAVAEFGAPAASGAIGQSLF